MVLFMILVGEGLSYVDDLFCVVIDLFEMKMFIFDIESEGKEVIVVEIFEEYFDCVELY